MVEDTLLLLSKRRSQSSTATAYVGDARYIECLTDGSPDVEANSIMLVKPVQQKTQAPSTASRTY